MYLLSKVHSDVSCDIGVSLAATLSPWFSFLSAMHGPWVAVCDVLLVVAVWGVVGVVVLVEIVVKIRQAMGVVGGDENCGVRTRGL